MCARRHCDKHAVAGSLHSSSSVGVGGNCSLWYSCTVLLSTERPLLPLQPPHHTGCPISISMVIAIILDLYTSPNFPPLTLPPLLPLTFFCQLPPPPIHDIYTCTITLDARDAHSRPSFPRRPGLTGGSLAFLRPPAPAVALAHTFSFTDKASTSPQQTTLPEQTTFPSPPQRPPLPPISYSDWKLISIYGACKPPPGTPERCCPGSSSAGGGIPWAKNHHHCATKRPQYGSLPAYDLSLIGGFLHNLETANNPSRSPATP